LPKADLALTKNVATVELFNLGESWGTYD